MDFSTIVLTVNAIVIPHSQIHGIITISRRENEAALMRVTLIPSVGLQDLDYWAGKDITLVSDATTIYTGVIDIPEIDLIYKKITLACTDNRHEILGALDVSAIGFYSLNVFSETENTIDELDQRLQTIPSYADILPSGAHAITDINPKTIPDFTLTDVDIYYRRPEVIPTSRNRLINTVNLNFKMRFTRKRHREWNFQISENTFCDYAENPASIHTKKEEFYSYIDSMDWHLNESSVVFEDMPASGLITICDGPDFLWYNLTDLYALNVQYSSAVRFGQTITENFNITVQAPQSVTQYGIIDTNQDNSSEIEFDISEFEAQKTYQPPDGMTLDTNDYYFDEDGTTEYSDAVLAALNIANTKIITSHRDTTVKFETDIRLDFNLTHTVELSSDIIDAKGKLSSIHHEIDINKRKGNTLAEISLSTAQGAATADALTAPTRPTVPVIADAFADPTIIPLSLFNTGDMVTPDIDDTSRNEQIIDTVLTYDVEIQNDTFSVTF